MTIKKLRRPGYVGLFTFITLPPPIVIEIKYQFNVPPGIERAGENVV